ncbi:MAG: M12 family metallo-peptidase [Nitrospirota bacterium]
MSHFIPRKKIGLLILLFLLGCDLDKTLPNPLFDSSEIAADQLIATEDLAEKPEATDLFSPLQRENVHLTSDQQSLIAKIEAHPYNTDLMIVNIDADLVNAESLNMAISPDTTVSFQKKRLDEENDGRFSWYGEDPDNEKQSTLLVVNGDSVTGVITMEAETYRIYPLGENLHAVTRLDYANLPPHASGHLEGGSNGAPTSSPFEKGSSFEKASSSEKDAPAETNEGPIMDVLVVYTPAVGKAIADIDGLIQFAIADTNQTYINSGVHQRLRLVHAQQVTYTEMPSTSGFHNALNHLQAEKDSFMDDVHGLRKQYNADIVSLLIDNAAFCGLGYLNANLTHAFTAVHYGCAHGGVYAFGHEIGHLQGAMHNPEDSPSTSPFPYGYGYRYKNKDAKKSWRTVMSYDCNPSCMSIPHWSNPSRFRDNVAMGTATKHNNVRVLNETAEKMAAFMGTSHVELAVLKEGEGTGRVSSKAKGIDCGTECIASFAQGSKISLVARPAAGSFFSKWSASCAEAASPICDLTMDSAKSAIVQFDNKPPPIQTLNRNLNLTVTGGGEVSGSGIDCPSICTASVKLESLVRLTARPNEGSIFKGWKVQGHCAKACVEIFIEDTKECHGLGSCSLKMDADIKVTAEFQEIKQLGAPVLIETNDKGSANMPRIATDSAGHAIAVWRQATRKLYNIWANQYVTNSGWGIPTMIGTETPGHAVFPQVAMDSAGNAIAVWQQFNKKRSDIWANRFVSGTGWGTATLIETQEGNALFPQIAVDPTGNAIAVWQQVTKKRTDIWASRFVASTGWEPPLLVELNDIGNALSPQIAVDQTGNAIAVWQQSDKKRNSIWANRFIVGTLWGTSTLIETNDDGNAISPQIAMAPTGNAIAVWQQSNKKETDIWSNQFVVGTLWGTPTLIETNESKALSPQVVVDAAGNAIALWQQIDEGQNSIWANQFSAGTWGVAALIEKDNVGNAAFPQVSVNAAGNAVSVWQQFDGIRNNILSSKYTVGTGWGVPELIEVNDQGKATSADVAIDFVGNAIAVWEQFDKKRTNIWANRF